MVKLDGTARFFPVKGVSGIGEVKSDLTQKELADSLIKLSKNKQVFELYNPELSLYIEQGYEPENPYHNFFSFLICNKITDFNIKTINNIILEAYNDNGISPWHQHNIVVSLEMVSYI